MLGAPSALVVPSGKNSLMWSSKPRLLKPSRSPLSVTRIMWAAIFSICLIVSVRRRGSWRTSWGMRGSAGGPATAGAAAVADVDIAKNSDLLAVVPAVYPSTARFIRWWIGIVRCGIHFGAPGFTQRGLLVLLELFFLAARARRSRSLGAISSVIRLECHCDARWLIPHYWALYMHPALPSQHHMGAPNSIKISTARIIKLA